MYSYEDRIRAVKLYLKLGKRTGATILQFGYPTEERAQELASRIRTRRRFARELCAFQVEVFGRAEESSHPLLPQP